jgi:antitoxin FitA
VFGIESAWSPVGGGGARVGLYITRRSAINAIMSQLVVRNLEETLVRKLKKRATEHGVSAEEEHRRILRQALSEPEDDFPDLKAVLLAMPDVGDDALFARLPDLPREIDFP